MQKAEDSAQESGNDDPMTNDLMTQLLRDQLKGLRTAAKIRLLALTEPTEVTQERTELG